MNLEQVRAKKKEYAAKEKAILKKNMEKRRIEIGRIFEKNTGVILQNKADFAAVADYFQKYAFAIEKTVKESRTKEESSASSAPDDQN